MEELVYELNPLGEWIWPLQCPTRVVGGGDGHQQTDNFPSPQTTEAGPWKFLAALIPILSLMEITAALSGSQVGMSSSPFLATTLICM